MKSVSWLVTTQLSSSCMTLRKTITCTCILCTGSFISLISIQLTGKNSLCVKLWFAGQAKAVLHCYSTSSIFWHTGPVPQLIQASIPPSELNRNTGCFTAMLEQCLEPEPAIFLLFIIMLQLTLQLLNCCSWPGHGGECSSWDPAATEARTNRLNTMGRCLSAIIHHCGTIY